MIQLSIRSIGGRRVASVAMTLLLLVITISLYPIAVGYRGYAGRYPQLLLLIALISLVSLLIKQVILETYDIQILSNSGEDETSEIMEYFTGGASQYSSRRRALRIGSLLFWTILFFPVGAINLLLAIAVCYTGMMVTLGIRDWKKITGSVIAMEILVYILFIRLLNVPVEVF